MNDKKIVRLFVGTGFILFCYTAFAVEPTTFPTNRTLDLKKPRTETSKMDKSNSKTSHDSKRFDPKRQMKPRVPVKPNPTKTQ